jgi:hypothetical protein
MNRLDNPAFTTSDHETMEFIGLIRMRPGGRALTYAEWCKFIRRRPDFVHGEPLQGTNPFTGKPVPIAPRPDTASVMKDGKAVVQLNWSQSGTDEVLLRGERSEVISLGLDIAAALGGEFVESPADDSMEPL